MRADDAEQTAQPVQRLNHRRDDRGVAAVAREDLSDRYLQPANQLLGLRSFLLMVLSSEI